MKLYIDTNIYLSYVNPTSDLKPLRNLKKLIEGGKVEVVLPSQTKKEYLKHFKERALQEKTKLEKAKTQFSIPNELKNARTNKTKEEKEIIEQIDSLNLSLKKYRTKKIDDFKNHIKIAEKELGEIINLATFFEYTDEIIVKGMIRYAKDLPPKKNELNSKFGDAIIWETLKDNIRNEDLVVVSRDSDFSEKIQNKTISKILANEWKKHTKKKITLFPTLAGFVNTLYKEDPVSKDTVHRETVTSSVFTVPVYTAKNNATFFTTNELGMTGTALNINTGTTQFYSPNLSTTEAGVFFTGANARALTGSDILANTLKTSSGIEPAYSTSLMCSICHKRYTPGLNLIGINICTECSDRLDNLGTTTWKVNKG